MVKQGKVRAVGCSNYSADQLQTALAVSESYDLVRFESLQLHYNMI
ncbi:MAG: hypothetical protein HF973_15150 [Chloroflexi bacterium]|nr:hypothetical protein [Chloroflexota bacterium]